VQVFGIFEGGGAKGLAHVGTIAAAQELSVQFVGVAGASAGAMVALLIAVGYNARRLSQFEVSQDAALKAAVACGAILQAQLSR
jgi:NTE family protein